MSDGVFWENNEKGRTQICHLLCVTAKNLSSVSAGEGLCMIFYAFFDKLKIL